MIFLVDHDRKCLIAIDDDARPLLRAAQFPGDQVTLDQDLALERVQFFNTEINGALHRRRRRHRHAGFFQDLRPLLFSRPPREGVGCEITRQADARHEHNRTFRTGRAGELRRSVDQRIDRHEIGAGFSRRLGGLR